MAETTSSANHGEAQDPSCDAVEPLVVADKPAAQVVVVGEGDKHASEPRHRDEPASQIETNDETKQAAPPPRPDFSMGDHVYQWCSYWGIPAVFAHHGIVLDVLYCPTEQQWRLRLVDFSNNTISNDDLSSEQMTVASSSPDDSLIGTNDSEASPAPENTTTSPANTGEDVRNGDEDNTNKSNSSNSNYSPKHKERGCSIRVYETDPSAWRKVTYQATLWREQFSRSGTATRAAADPPGMVRARVQFLIDHHAAIIPTYDAVRSNSECVAVWCKTGTWATLQATSWLSAMAVGQVKSTVTLAGAAASAQVAVPSAGLWGWMGYTTQVSLLSTQPWLVPALAGYGFITIGAPALWLTLAQRHWKKLTQKLNSAFWEAAVENPDIFSERIMQWSTAADQEHVGVATTPPPIVSGKTTLEVTTTATTALARTDGQSKRSNATTAASSTDTSLPELPSNVLPAETFDEATVGRSEDKNEAAQHVSQQLPCQEPIEG